MPAQPEWPEGRDFPSLQSRRKSLQESFQCRPTALGCPVQPGISCRRVTTIIPPYYSPRRRRPQCQPEIRCRVGRLQVCITCYRPEARPQNAPRLVIFSQACCLHRTPSSPTRRNTSHITEEWPPFRLNAQNQAGENHTVARSLTTETIATFTTPADHTAFFCLFPSYLPPAVIADAIENTPHHAFHRHCLPAHAADHRQEN